MRVSDQMISQFLATNLSQSLDNVYGTVIVYKFMLFCILVMQIHPRQRVVSENMYRNISLGNFYSMYIYLSYYLNVFRMMIKL